ncbi:MAG: hypothetical protein J6A47_09785 [Bacilli bacterium]|nr:hypothetical protein [Bacilli bacterium]MBO6286394.1 hypothetical protein [Bacilli bacterium]
MSQGAYLAIVIAVLIGLGVLALGLFLLLRRGPKIEREKCQGCEQFDCPLAKALEEKR